MDKYNNSNKVLVVGDCHIDDEQDLSRFNNLGNYIIEHRPDEIILIGDFLSFNCFSAWDFNKRAVMENRRRQAEIEAGREALQRMLGPSMRYNFKRKRSKKNRYNPKIVYLGGNHEDRERRYLEQKPELLGSIDYFADLGLSMMPFDNVVHVPYRDYYYTNGVGFTHIPMNKMNTPINGQRIMRTALDLHAHSVVFGHCFSEDTELLTENGWKNIDEIPSVLGLKVATINPNTEKIEYQQYTSKWVYYDRYNSLIHFKNNSMDHLVTPEHGMVYKSKTSPGLKYTKARDFKSISTLNIVSSTLDDNIDTINISEDEIRLLVQCITDGNIDHNKYWSWHLKKDRKIKRLMALLDRLGLPYSKSEKNNKGAVKIYVGYITDYYTSKIIPSWIKQVSYNNRCAFLDEWSRTDGTIYKENKYVQLQTSIKEHADILQELCFTSGHKSNLNGKYTLSVRYNVKETYNHYNFNKGEIPYKGRVYCLSVPNGTLVARRNGKVLVTQNTHELRIDGEHRHGAEHYNQVLNCGCFFEHTQEYSRGAKHDDWRGIVELNMYSYNRFDINTVSLSRLKTEY